MKLYFLFYTETYYPAGGFDDLVSIHYTLAEATDALNKRKERIDDGMYGTYIINELNTETLAVAVV